MITHEDILKEAQNLRDQPHPENRRRTILGRAYYAAYHFLLTHDCTKELEKFRTDREVRARKDSSLRKLGSHSLLIEFLGEAEDAPLRYAGSQLGDLYTRRINADYRLSLNVQAEEAVDAVEVAEELIEGTLVGWIPKKTA